MLRPESRPQRDAERGRPPWLEAVADEPGVRVVPRAACTEPFATV